MKKEEYVFIQGIGRTGSKIYMNILNSSNQIAILPEIKFMTIFERDMLYAIKKCGDLNCDSNVEKLTKLLWKGFVKAEFWRRIEKNKIKIDRNEFSFKLKNTNRSKRNVLKTLIELYAEYENKPRGGAKFPVHFSYTSTLLNWFPDSHIIHIVRDPRATSVSHARNLLILFQNKFPFKNSNIFFYKMLLIHGVFEWIWDIKENKKFNGFSNYYISHFEDLVNNPEENIELICNFLNIKSNDKMMKPPIVDSSYISKEKNGFDKKAINRWEDFISPIDRAWINILTKKYMKFNNFEYYD